MIRNVSIVYVLCVTAATFFPVSQCFSISRTSTARKSCTDHDVLVRKCPFILQSSPNDGEDSTESLEPASRERPAAPQPSRPRKRLDPLIALLTRNDDEDSRNAPTTKVPLIGEFVLDKSLFVVLPVAFFAIGGLLLSFYVAINSGDAIVQATNQLAESMTTTPTYDPDVCRGLCKSESNTIEQFMNSLRK